MGIPRFYRWLKSRYPMIRFDLSDSNKQIPIFDNFYIDFNALVYQCIRQSGCFLKNKIKPLTFEQINQRVIEYLLQLVRVVNPRKLLFIAFDGVAPRAKINQSRDRRFRSGVQDIQFFEQLVDKVGILTKQNFESNSISPGTEFLFNLCNNLKAKIMELLNTEWKGLHVFYSDCCVPGEGQHKIMQFLRYSKEIELFNKNTTHCVFSPDADVILLTLSLNIQYICIIKEDTSVLPSMNWTATSTYRKFGPPQFELVMINIVREYFECQFREQIRQVKNCTVQDIINDFVLLMAFVGNDFLPVEFCFVLKDNHMDILFNYYKDYLKQHQSFINNQGKIDWQNVTRLLKLAKRFEANRIQEMKNQKKMKNYQNRDSQSIFDDNDKEKQEESNSQIQKFEIQDEKIVSGFDNYYQSRFNIQDRKKSAKFTNIIKKYIEGLEFYCQYYYLGLPSWTWYYPYHYTPLLSDVYDYLMLNPIQVELKKDEPFDPILALMFMLPQANFGLLPPIVSDVLIQESCILRQPIDYFPRKFDLDKFQTLKYHKKAMIEFLNDQDVRTVYNQISKQKYTKEQLERNSRKNTLLFYQNRNSFIGIQCDFNEKFKEQLKRIVRAKYEGKHKDSNQRRFPTLTIFGDDLQFNQKGKLVSKQKFKYQGSPTELVFFNNFLGYVQKVQKTNQIIKDQIQTQYQRKIGLSGTCQNYYIVKRGHYIREIERHHITLTRKEVIVPDFALFKAPNYEYIKKTQKYEFKDQFQLKETVVVLSNKYFGCMGTIEELGQKAVKVKLASDPIKSQQKIQQIQQQFFTTAHVINELEISKQSLFSIISEIVILPVMKKKQEFNERLPTALNFGLNFIDVEKMKIVPRFVRCNFAQSSKNQQSAFESLQFSATALKVLQRYVKTFEWLVQLIQQSKSSKIRRQFKAGSIFKGSKQPNIRVYQQFIKLYSFDTRGSFTSIFSKTADLDKLPNMYTEKKGSNAIVTFSYYEIISRSLAIQAPPPYKSEPQYFDIGSRVIYLKSLQTGYVVCIDDHSIHVILGKDKTRIKAKFTDLYCQSWQYSLSKGIGKCWNLQVGYYTPTYWKKAIS